VYDYKHARSIVNWGARGSILSIA